MLSFPRPPPKTAPAEVRGRGRDDSWSHSGGAPKAPRGPRPQQPWMPAVDDNYHSHARVGLRPEDQLQQLKYQVEQLRRLKQAHEARHAQEAQQAAEVLQACQERQHSEAQHLRRQGLANEAQQTRKAQQVAGAEHASQVRQGVEVLHSCQTQDVEPVHARRTQLDADDQYERQAQHQVDRQQDRWSAESQQTRFAQQEYDPRPPPEHAEQPVQQVQTQHTMCQGKPDLQKTTGVRQGHEELHSERSEGWCQQQLEELEEFERAFDVSIVDVVQQVPEAMQACQTQQISEVQRARQVQFAPEAQHALQAQQAAEAQNGNQAQQAAVTQPARKSQQVDEPQRVTEAQHVVEAQQALERQRAGPAQEAGQAWHLRTSSQGLDVRQLPEHAEEAARQMQAQQIQHSQQQPTLQNTQEAPLDQDECYAEQYGESRQQQLEMFEDVENQECAEREQTTVRMPAGASEQASAADRTATHAAEQTCAVTRQQRKQPQRRGCSPHRHMALDGTEAGADQAGQESAISGGRDLIGEDRQRPEQPRQRQQPQRRRSHEEQPVRGHRKLSPQPLHLSPGRRAASSQPRRRRSRAGRGHAAQSTTARPASAHRDACGLRGGRRRSAPEWDFTQSDMSRYQLSPAQQLRRHLLRISKNRDEAAVKVQQKLRRMQQDIGPFLAFEEPSGPTGDAASSSTCPPRRRPNMSPCFASRVPTGRIPEQQGCVLRCAPGAPGSGAALGATGGAQPDASGIVPSTAEAALQDPGFLELAQSGDPLDEALAAEIANFCGVPSAVHNVSGVPLAVHNVSGGTAPAVVQAVPQYSVLKRRDSSRPGAQRSATKNTESMRKESDAQMPKQHRTDGGSAHVLQDVSSASLGADADEIAGGDAEDDEIEDGAAELEAQLNWWRQQEQAIISAARAAALLDDTATGLATGGVDYGTSEEGTVVRENAPTVASRAPNAPTEAAPPAPGTGGRGQELLPAQSEWLQLSDTGGSACGTNHGLTGNSMCGSGEQSARPAVVRGSGSGEPSLGQAVARAIPTMPELQETCVTKPTSSSAARAAFMQLGGVEPLATSTSATLDVRGVFADEREHVALVSGSVPDAFLAELVASQASALFADTRVVAALGAAPAPPIPGIAAPPAPAAPSTLGAAATSPVADASPRPVPTPSSTPSTALCAPELVPTSAAPSAPTPLAGAPPTGMSSTTDTAEEFAEATSAGPEVVLSAKPVPSPGPATPFKAPVAVSSAEPSSSSFASSKTASAPKPTPSAKARPTPEVASPAGLQAHSAASLKGKGAAASKSVAGAKATKKASEIVSLEGHTANSAAAMKRPAHATASQQAASAPKPVAGGKAMAAAQARDVKAEAPAPSAVQLKLASQPTFAPGSRVHAAASEADSSSGQRADSAATPREASTSTSAVLAAPLESASWAEPIARAIASLRKASATTASAVASSSAPECASAAPRAVPAAPSSLQAPGQAVTQTPTRPGAARPAEPSTLTPVTPPPRAGNAAISGGKNGADPARDPSAAPGVPAYTPSPVSAAPSRVAAAGIRAVQAHEAASAANVQLLGSRAGVDANISLTGQAAGSRAVVGKSVRSTVEVVSGSATLPFAACCSKAAAAPMPSKQRAAPSGQAHRDEVQPQRQRQAASPTAQHASRPPSAQNSLAARALWTPDSPGAIRQPVPHPHGEQRATTATGLALGGAAASSSSAAANIQPSAAAADAAAALQAALVWAADLDAKEADEAGNAFQPRAEACSGAAAVVGPDEARGGESGRDEDRDLDIDAAAHEGAGGQEPGSAATAQNSGHSSGQSRRRRQQQPRRPRSNSPAPRGRAAAGSAVSPTVSPVAASTAAELRRLPVEGASMGHAATEASAPSPASSGGAAVARRLFADALAPDSALSEVPPLPLNYARAEMEPRPAAGLEVRDFAELFNL